MKIYLLTFSSTNYNYSKNIVANEAATLNIFDNIWAYDENDLDPYIYNIIQERIKKYGWRLYGYSTWRPYLILKHLKEIEYGDILIYFDSDFISLNENIEKTRNFILTDINRLITNKHSILVRYGESSDDLLYTTTKLRKCIENCLKYKFTLNELISAQYSSNTIFIKKDYKSLKIINLWNNILQNNFDLVTDIHNDDDDNPIGFCDNRHEQSILSLLCKYYHIEPIVTPIYDLFFNHNYDYEKYANEINYIKKIEYQSILETNKY